MGDLLSKLFPRSSRRTGARWVGIPAALVILCATLDTSVPAAAAGRSAPGPRQDHASVVLDGVRVDVSTPFLPSGRPSISRPGFASQTATWTAARPFGQVELIAVPFGTRNPFEALPVAGAGRVTAYRDALRSFREGQGATFVAAPRATIFGRSTPGLASIVRLNLNGPARRPVLVAEWVAEAGQRLWVLRVSRALDTAGPARATPALRSFEPLSVRGADLSAPTTVGRLSGPVAPAPRPPARPNQTLPPPSWWKGTCDDTTYYDATGDHTYPLGATYEGMQACGPMPSHGYPDVLVRFFPGAWGEYEWECVELAMRYLYLADGIDPYNANGSQVVWNYPGTLLQKVSNVAGSGVAPVPGDVLSFGPTNTLGHTSVVTSSNVNSSGNGTIGTIEENASPSGSLTISVSNWYVETPTGYPGPVTGWLHDPSAPSSGWSVASAPSPGDAASLYGVASVSATGAWAVGSYQQSGVTKTLVERWSNGAWGTVTSPNPGGGSNQLLGIAASGPSYAWAVGYSGDGSGGATLTEQWNGSAWAAVPSPDVAGAQDTLSSVGIVAPGNVWAVGDSQASGGTVSALVLHLERSGWRIERTPKVASGSSLQAVSAVPGTKGVWVGGYSLDSSGHANALIERHAGGGWQVEPVPTPGESSKILGITAASKSDAWAVGYEQDPTTNYWRTFTLHWNGTAWSQVSSPNSGSLGNALYAVSGGGSNVWAVGYAKNSSWNPRTLTEQWNGKSWAIVASPNAAGSAVDQLRGVSLVPGATGACGGWTVGYQYAAGGPNRTLAEQYVCS